MNLALMGKSSNMMDQVKTFTSTGHFTSIAVSGDGNLIFYKEGSGNYPVKVRSKSLGYDEAGHSVADGGIGRGLHLSSDTNGSNIIMVNYNGSSTPSVSFYSYNISTGFTNLIDIALPSSNWLPDIGLCSMSPDGNTASAVVDDYSVSRKPKVIIYKKNSGTWVQHTIISVDGLVNNFVLCSDTEGVLSANSPTEIKRYTSVNASPVVAQTIAVSGLRSNQWGHGLAFSSNGLIATTDSSYNSGINSSIEVISPSSGLALFFITAQTLPGGNNEKINHQVSLSSDGTLLTFSTESVTPKLYLYRRNAGSSEFNFECFLTRNDSNTSGGYLVKGEAGGYPRKNLACSLDGKVQVGIAENVSRIFVI